MKSFGNSGASMPAHSYDSSATNVVELEHDGKINLLGIVFENNEGAAIYVQLFDKASEGEVALGTDTPYMEFMIPSNDGLVLFPDSGLKHFANGLCYAVTASRGGSDAAGSPGSVNFFYNP